MDYISVKQAAERWGISERRVRLLCSLGKIEGAFQVGRAWNIPATAKKPTDGRIKNNDTILSRINLKKEQLDSMRPLTKGELERLMHEFMVEYTYNSNAIEGNTLTLRETDIVLQGITIDTKPLKYHMEAIGHRDAFYYVLDLVKEQAPLSESLIKQIHALVLMDKPQDRGVYRKVPVRIMGAADIPPEPYLIDSKMQHLILDYNNSEGYIVERVARLHLDFEGIHPFIDGNGRTGRLIVNLELMKAGYPPVDIKYQDRNRYYKAFESYFGNGDLKPMLNLFSEYVDERLDKYLSILE